MNEHVRCGLSVIPQAVQIQASHGRALQEAFPGVSLMSDQPGVVGRQSTAEPRLPLDDLRPRQILGRGPPRQAIGDSPAEVEAEPAGPDEGSGADSGVGSGGAGIGVGSSGVAAGE